MALDFLVEEGLTDFQRSLQRALSNLPHQPSDIANVARLRSGLREVLELLNYENADTPVRGLDGALAQDIDARVVATRNGFDIIHLHLPRLRASVARPAVERVTRDQNHPQSLVVATSSDPSDEGAWHFINVKDGARGRRVLRRAVVEPPFVGRTVLQTLSQCQVRSDQSVLQIEIAHEFAFDVERVTERFYEDYKRVFAVIVTDLQKQIDRVSAHAFAQQLLNRLMFLYFIQRKRRRAPGGGLIWWLNNERDFVLNLWRRYKQESAERDTFYAQWLRPLFFMAFNHNYGFQTLSLPQDVKDALANLPWLNGGLFAETPIDRQAFTVRDEHFIDIFNNLLERYNFTIREDTPLDVEVAVDPEMLGKVYESLVIQEERGQAGIFYTPRVELDFMCRRSLVEHLAGKTSLSRPDVIRLVMNAELGEDLPAFTAPQRDEILRALEEVTVVDPACGSGAFLVGMMEVLMGLFELLYAQKQQAFDRFHRKKEIICRNLYGVDIKEWAIRVAELRLWLSLVIETEEAGLDVTRPLLPNLSFRLRVGDSLVEEIADQQLALRAGDSGMGKRLREMVRELSRKKAHYFGAEGDVSEAEIRHDEQALLRKILEDRADTLSKQIARLRAAEEGTRAAKMMEGLSTPLMAQRAEEDAQRLAERTAAKAQELDVERNAIRTALSRGLGTRPFLWEIDFAEIFWRPDDSPGGFDIVIGNPPYVRNEEIVPLNVPPEQVTREVKRAYKDKLYRSVQLLWGTVPLDRACDYYVYFYFDGLSLLREGGLFCFINSNSWLDVEYGAALQDFLLRRMQVLDIYDNQARRTFKAADINTIIVLIRRPEPGVDVGGHLARFAAFKKPFEECLTAENVTTIESAAESVVQDDFRATLRTQAELYEEGMAAAPRTAGQQAAVQAYTGSKWGGRYLRAPDIFFEILDRAGDKLVRLGDIAHIDSGINTRANDFFYLKRVPREQWSSVPLQNFSGRRIPDDCQVVRSDVGVARTRNCDRPLSPTYWVIESRFLRPVIIEPQESDTIIIKSEALQHLVLSVYDDWDELEGTYARGYIEYSMQSHQTRQRRGGRVVEGLAVNQRPELSRRKQALGQGRHGAWWYAVRDKEYGRILLPKRASDSFRVLFNPDEVTVNQNLYNLVDFEPAAEIGLLLFLNSGLTALARELLGRANLGLGVLENAGVDWAQLPCPTLDVLLLVERDYADLQSLVRRPIRAIEEETRTLDKAALDEVVLRSLGADPAVRQELADATTTLVRNRLSKAATFRREQAGDARLKAVESLRGIWSDVPEELTEDEEAEDEP